MFAILDDFMHLFNTILPCIDIIRCGGINNKTTQAILFDRYIFQVSGYG